MSDKSRDSDKNTGTALGSTETPSQPVSHGRYAMAGNIASESLDPIIPATTSSNATTAQAEATIYDQTQNTADVAFSPGGDKPGTNYFQTKAADYIPGGPEADEEIYGDEEPFTTTCTTQLIKDIEESVLNLVDFLPELWNTPSEDMPSRMLLSSMATMCERVTDIVRVPGASEVLNSQLKQAVTAWENLVDEELQRQSDGDSSSSRCGSPEQDESAQTSGDGQETEWSHAEHEMGESSSGSSGSSGPSTVRATAPRQQQGGGDSEEAEAGAIQRRVEDEAAFRRELSHRPRVARQARMWSIIRNMGNERAHTPSSDPGKGASSGNE